MITWGCQELFQRGDKILNQAPLSRITIKVPTSTERGKTMGNKKRGHRGSTERSSRHLIKVKKGATKGRE